MNKKLTARLATKKLVSKFVHQVLENRQYCEKNVSAPANIIGFFAFGTEISPNWKKKQKSLNNPRSMQLVVE